VEGFDDPVGPGDGGVGAFQFGGKNLMQTLGNKDNDEMRPW
jgi:hypothetical protein